MVLLVEYSEMLNIFRMRGCFPSLLKNSRNIVEKKVNSIVISKCLTKQKHLSRNSLIFLARPQSYKNRIESIECRARVVIKSNNLTVDPVDLRIPKINAVIRKRVCTLVFDNLQQNVCDVMKEYFTKNTHGKNTRNGKLSVKL